MMFTLIFVSLLLSFTVAEALANDESDLIKIENIVKPDSTSTKLVPLPAINRSDTPAMPNFDEKQQDNLYLSHPKLSHVIPLTDADDLDSTEERRLFVDTTAEVFLEAYEIDKTNNQSSEI